MTETSSAMMQTPAILEHCRTIWFAMQEAAVQKPEGPDGMMIEVYEGYLTKLFKEHRFSTPYYTYVMNKLIDMDCVRQIRRGGGNTPSRWMLVQEPTTDLYFSGAHTKRKLGDKAPKETQMQQQIRDLHNRVTALENWQRISEATRG